MNLPSPNICKTIRNLYARVGSSNEHEAKSARDKLLALLKKHSLHWLDIPAIVAAADADEAARTATKAARHSASPTSGPEFNVLTIVLHLIETRIATTPEERMALALWTLHTWVFGRYRITPRLALLSPVRGCGKTTAIVLLKALCADPHRSDNISAAAIYYKLAYREHTMLIDEGDNLGLLDNSVLRSVLNGNERGSSVDRVVGGRPRSIPLFAPFAIAAIGTLPLPLMDRAIVINMRRHAKTDAPLRELDEHDHAFILARDNIQKWAATCTLAPKPAIPPELHNRVADNWRPLFAIADNLGYGEAARAAAVALSGDRLEDPGVVLLGDIYTVFETLGVDRIASATLAEALVALEDGLWHDWHGRKLTQFVLARMLRPFGIRSVTMWPTPRLPGSMSSRGYFRSQFEKAWASYCGSTHSTHSAQSKVRQLRTM
jgi:Protein of unknown function (DUF3631)